VIVPTYRSGPELDRLVASLDAQTMPHTEFEAVFVDDGSPDDTYLRLLEIARSRPWVRVHRIEPSGWPSRPRNLGVQWATGEYVLFADHDDTLFPDGLRAAYAFAREHDADVVNPKEVRTNRPAWGLSVYDADHVYARDEAPAEALSPWTPHKLYRRALLLEHGIRFPERAHHMWEDNLFNVDVFAAARTIAVLAHTPVYHWQRGGTTSSSSYGQDQTEYWDAVDLVIDHVERTMSDPALAPTRAAMVAKRISLRVLGQLGKRLLRRAPGEREYVLDRAHRTVTTHFPPELDHLLEPRHRVLVELVRADRRQAVLELARRETTVVAKPATTSVAWTGGALAVTGTATWVHDDGTPLAFRRTSVDGAERLERPLPAGLADVQAAALDWSPAVASSTVHLLVRERHSRVSWRVPTTTTPRVVDVEGADGPVTTVVLDWSAELDLGTAACGAALGDGLWDVVAEMSTGGFYSRYGLWADLRTLPALIEGRPVLAYRNAGGRLSLDVGQVGRPLLSRARVNWDASRSHGEDDGSVAFRVPVGRVHAFGPAEIRGRLELEPVWAGRPGWRSTVARHSPGWLRRRVGWDRTAVRLVSDDDGVHLDGTVEPRRRGPVACRLSFAGRSFEPRRDLVPAGDGVRFPRHADPAA